jgi:DNA-binding LacI/PurR family transcriptional regulator
MTNGKGETEIELLYIPQGQKFEGKGMFICFETEKLDEMHKLAQDEGFNPSEIQDTGDQTRYFYVYDPHRATAFVCHCDKAAFFLMGTLKKNGIKVPQEVSIVSFDNTSICDITTQHLQV